MGSGSGFNWEHILPAAVTVRMRSANEAGEITGAPDTRLIISPDHL
jgi:hypothetical protein